MSHFTVLVVTDAYPSHDVLTATLQPWHTYESTGIKDHYVTFVPATAAEIAAYAEHQATYQTIAAYFQDYHGYERHAGQWGYWTNSHAKWDSWQVGGRWTGFFTRIDGQMTDIAQKQDIDITRMRLTKAINATERYQTVHAVIAGRAVIPWSHVQAAHDTLDAARAAYYAQPVIQDLGAHRDTAFLRIEDFLCPQDAYVERAEQQVLQTFAVVKDGHWYEQGSMGWFAIVREDKGAAWTDEFHQLIECVTDEQWLTIV
ncbi:MAG: hypothetical protein AAGF95_35240, partial [Chloroflexota bacterium]